MNREEICNLTIGRDVVDEIGIVRDNLPKGNGASKIEVRLTTCGLLVFYTYGRKGIKFEELKSEHPVFYDRVIDGFCEASDRYGVEL